VALRYPSPLVLVLAALVLVAAFGGASLANAQTPEYQVPTPPVNNTPATPPYLSPLPTVRFVGSFSRSGARIKMLSVVSPRGSKVTARCSGGRRRGCPYKKRSATSPKSKKVRFKSLERRFKPGVILRIYVTRGNTVGKYTSFKVRSNRAPSRRDLCLLPGDPTEPTSCPG
jgi:hypothetical protein